MTIHFDNPIEPMFARLQVFDSNGVEVDSGTPSVSSDAIELSVALKPIGAGDYTVKWSVAGRDSHSTKGSFVFTVTTKAPK